MASGLRRPSRQSGTRGCGGIAVHQAWRSQMRSLFGWGLKSGVRCDWSGEWTPWISCVDLTELTRLWEFACEMLKPQENVKNWTLER
jgi:hypothetical protein